MDAFKTSGTSPTTSTTGTEAEAGGDVVPPRGGKHRGPRPDRDGGSWTPPTISPKHRRDVPVFEVYDGSRWWAAADFIRHALDHARREPLIAQIREAEREYVGGRLYVTITAPTALHEDDVYEWVEREYLGLDRLDLTCIPGTNLDGSAPDTAEWFAVFESPFEGRWS